MQLLKRFPVLLLACMVNVAPAYALRAIDIQADTVESEAGKARSVRLQWNIADSQAVPDLQLSGQVRSEKGRGWQAYQLACREFALPASHEPWRCHQGQFKSGEMYIPFHATVNHHVVHNQEIVGAEIQVHSASFNNADGSRAADKFTAALSLNASRNGGQWHWVTDLDWKSGELYWQPFYFAGGGHSLHAKGSLDTHFIRVRQSTIQMNKIGRVAASGEFRLDDQKLLSARVAAQGLALAQAYPLMFQPVLADSAFAELDIDGKADLSLEIHEETVQSFRLALHEVDLEDKNGKFAFYKINAEIPWDYDQPQLVGMQYEGGHLFKIPLAASQWQAEVNRYAVTAPELKMNILDGALVLSDVSAAMLGGNWHWHLQANLTPLDMPSLSSALGWPRMEGKVAAAIPRVTYSNGLLTTDGALGFNLFNGSIRMSNLTMRDPMGNIPRLNADLEMRNLDLGALTRTFSFGAIEGKLDGDVEQLELINWQPVRFEARFVSSPGRYPKKISQRAVENISALGGAGAAAAIQRSFLRFFHEFNYQKLGISCRLRNDICKMDGVGKTPQGFVIVKGSGVPAITVLGYNQRVSWGELVSRIQRITENNVKPVIQ